MWHTLRKGTTSKLLFVSALDAADVRLGKTGLSAQTSGATAAYVREGGSRVHAVPLVAGKIGEHCPGSFVEVDARLLPGVYQFGVPAAVLAPGADSAVLMLRFPDAVLEPFFVNLVAYDPQDSNRLGMSALGPEGRLAALRGAFPRLTAHELEGLS
jgi:hypothetical protein